MTSASRNHVVTVPCTISPPHNADPAIAYYHAPALMSLLTLGPTAQPESTMQQATPNGMPPAARTRSEDVTMGGKVQTGEDNLSLVAFSKDGGGGIKPVDKRSLDYILRSGLAGGVAGSAAKTIVAPLDRVKILFQASSPEFAKYSGSWSGLALAVRDINRSEGISGLFKGHSVTLLRIFPYAAIKFLAYEQIRAIIIPSRDKETSFRRLISGSIAGVTSVFFTYPLEVIRVRLAFETKRHSRSSLSTICRRIYHEHAPSQSVTSRSGITNFYRGFTPTLVGMVPYAGVSFLTHDSIGDWLRSPSLAPYTTIPNSETSGSRSSLSKRQRGPRRAQLTASAELFSGAMAGLISQTSAYPLEVIRRRMQVGGAVGDGHRLGIAETARKIWLEKGFRGFWVGLTIGYMKIVPMVATSFFFYERTKWWLGI